MATFTPPDLHGHDYARAVVETMRQPLLVVSHDLRVLRANHTFYRTFDTEPELVEGCPLSELCEGRWDSSPLIALLSRASAEDTLVDGLEMTVEVGHAEHRTVLLNAQRLRLEQEPRAILVTMEDITERTQMEVELAVSEVRYRRLFEAAQDGILLVDAHTGDIVDANPFLENLLGYTPQEMVGRKLWEMGPFRDTVAAKAAFDEL